jgi:hypothetical protein
LRKNLENLWKLPPRRVFAKSRPKNLNPFSGRFPRPPNISKIFLGESGLIKGLAQKKLGDIVTRRARHPPQWRALPGSKADEPAEHSSFSDFRK